MRPTKAGLRDLVVVLVVVTFALTFASVAWAKTSVVFWHAMGGPLKSTLEQLVKEYNETHPDVEVVLQYQGNYGQLQQKLLASIAAGQPPTMAQAYSNWTEQFLFANAIVPLDPFIKGTNGLSERELSDVWPVFLEANRWGGVTWSFPFNKSIYVTFYNATLYRQKGLKAPETWEDLLRVAAATTEKSGDEIVRYGYGLRPNVDHFALFLLTNGGEWLSSDLQSARFNEGPGVEALQFMVDLLQRYKVSYYVSGYLDPDFGAGKVAAYAASVPGRPYVEQAVGDKFEWGVAPLPTHGSRRTPVAGTDLVIFSKASPADRAAAWDVIKWLTAPRQTALWSIGTYYLPVRRSAVDTPEFQAYLKKDPRNGAALVLLPYAVCDPPIQEWNKVRTFVSDAVEQAFLLKATPKQALDEAARKTESELARRK